MSAPALSTREQHIGVRNPPAHRASGSKPVCRRSISRSTRAALLAAASGITMREAAGRTRISHQAVSQAWRRLFGDRDPPSVTTRAATAERIAQLCVAGGSAAEISVETGASRGVVQQVLHSRGLRARDPRSRVAPAAVEAAVTAVVGGASIGEAATDHGMSYGHLARVLRGRSVVLSMGPRGRMDGRVRRALAHVEAGMSVPQACRLERCAPPGVYQRLARSRSTGGSR